MARNFLKSTTTYPILILLMEHIMKKQFVICIILIITIYLFSIPSAVTFLAKGEHTLSGSLGQLTKTTTNTFSATVRRVQSKLHISSASDQQDEH